MHLCHAEECITSFCFCCSVSDSLSLVQYLSHNLGLDPPPPQTGATIVGEDEICKSDSPIGPFLIHKV